MLERKSLKWPILLGIFMILLLVGLTVGWVLLNVFNAISSQSGSTLYWILLTVGSVSFGLVLTGVILYIVWTVQQINLNRRQSNFLDAVTHELKSPIASLKLFLQTLHRRTIDETQRQEFYKSMMEDVDRLDRTITQLLDVAKLQQESNEPEPATWVPLRELIDSVSRKVTAQYDIQESQMHISVPDCEVWSRPVDLEILLRNLLDNAVKYSGHPPMVVVEGMLAKNEDELRLVFQDNGSGVPRHLRRAIFQRFYRVGNELERTKPGTGLGLFLVRSIVKRMGGTIRVEDVSKQKGARFVLHVPQVRRRVSPTDPNP